MSEPQTKKTKVSTLDQLKALTTIVADTGDFEGTFQQVHFISTLNRWLEHIELNRFRPKNENQLHSFNPNCSNTH